MTTKKDKSLVDKQFRQAKKDLMNELLFDLYKNKKQIIKLNFFRGMAFGMGSAIGGSILLAMIVFLLTKVVDWFPIIGEFVKQIIQYIK